MTDHSNESGRNLGPGPLGEMLCPTPIGPVFRVWLVRPGGSWWPKAWFQRPPGAIAIEPLLRAYHNPTGAAAAVRAYNSATLKRGFRGTWAVAIEVQLAFDRDPVPESLAEEFCDPRLLAADSLGRPPRTYSSR